MSCAETVDDTTKSTMENQEIQSSLEEIKTSMEALKSLPNDVRQLKDAASFINSQFEAMKHKVDQLKNEAAALRN